MTYIGKDGRQYVVIAAGGPGNAQPTLAAGKFSLSPDAGCLCPAEARRQAGGHHRALSRARAGTGAVAAKLDPGGVILIER